MDFLRRYFKLAESGSDLRTEVFGGIVTFLTMSYIIFVNPAVISGEMFGAPNGLDIGAATTATCLAAAFATIVMALAARYPVALAPGMGANFFFVFGVVPAAAAAGFGAGWQTALGVVFVAGVLFLLISLSGLRELLMNAVSPSLKNGIAVGIGLFIAFVGLRNTGLILNNEATAVELNTAFASPDLIVFFFGLIVTTALFVRRLPGAILWGILASTLFALALRYGLALFPTAAESQIVAESMLMTRFQPAVGVFSLPPDIRPTLFAMDLAGAVSLAMIPLVIIFLFIDLFDTMGTLVAVGEQGGFMRNNKLPRANRAFLADATGTVAGAALGTSTVTSYIESASGIAQGARTGLASLVTAALFLLALFFSPIVGMVGSYAPVTAPALLLVGAMMLQNVRSIALDDFSESVPAFVIILGIPLSYSIADGIALGFIAYPVIKLLSGRWREVSPILYGLGLLLILYFLFLR